jgi:hypothetical protein
VARGARDYVWRQADHLSLLRELHHRYQHEGIAMAYTFEDFERDLARRLVSELPPEERLRGLTPEERLRGLSEEELQRLRQFLDTQLQHRRASTGARVGEVG